MGFKHTETCYVWSVNAANDVCYLLRRVRPWLLIKADAADEALEFLVGKYGVRLEGGGACG